MAEPLTVARPYAKAIFIQAVEADQVDAWEQILNLLATIVKDGEVIGLLNNPTITNEIRLRLILEVMRSAHETFIQSLGQQLENLIANLIGLLADANRLKIIPEISVLFSQLVAAQKQLLKVVVTSALPLTDQQKDSLKVNLQRRFNSHIEMDCKLDEDLMSGATIRVGNWVMDNSVKGKLQKLHDLFGI